MSERFEYKSTLTSYMNGFIELKEASGVNNLRAKWILLEIDKFYLENNITVSTITSDIISEWRKTRTNDCNRTLYAKYSVWSQLARFMCRQGQECYIPQMTTHRGLKDCFTPYIFTHEQIDAIMEKSTEMKLYDRHTSCVMYVIPTIIRLMYSTGLRVSETLSIMNMDVHIKEHYVHIKKTKNGSERLVPLSDNMSSVLEQYIYYRNKMPIKNVAADDSLLFIKMDGTPCHAGSIYTRFRWILKECGIPHYGNHHGPRVHDLRHTFAVHAFEQMERNGIDLYAGMPIISTCLGHKSLSATEQYVRLTYEMYPALAERCTPINAFIYPKVRKGVPYED